MYKKNNDLYIMFDNSLVHFNSKVNNTRLAWLNAYFQLHVGWWLERKTNKLCTKNNLLAIIRSARNFLFFKFSNRQLDLIQYLKLSSMFKNQDWSIFTVSKGGHIHCCKTKTLIA